MDKQPVEKMPENSKSMNESKVSSKLSSILHPRKIENMNLLIIEKISDIVAAYYNNMDKLTLYYTQIDTLVDYNKRLIDILRDFEAHEDKLIKRLKRMEEFHVEYMRGFCQAKSRQFKMPNLPQHKSIFANFNIQDLVFTMKPEPPFPQLKYKQELISIFKQCFLTRQDKLLSNIQVELHKNREEGEIKNLVEIRKLVREYNEEMVEFIDDRPFDLLKKRSVIRKKVQEFYDHTENRSEVRPDYLQEDFMINRVVNLQARVEDISLQTLKQFLHQQKQLCSCIYKQRSELQQTLKQKQKQIDKLNKVRESEVRQLQQQKYEMETRINRIGSVFQEEIKDLRAQLVEKELRLEQVENFIVSKNQEIQMLEGELQRLRKQNYRVPTPKPTQRVPQRQISQLPPKSIQPLHLQLHSRITTLQISPTPFPPSPPTSPTSPSLQQLLKSHRQQLLQKQKFIEDLKSQLMVHRETIKKYSEKVGVMEEEYRKQVDTIGYKLRIVSEENQKIYGDKRLVEDLAVQVCQAIRLISSMSFNDSIKHKLSQVLQKLQQFLQKYQTELQWDINKQSPGFFSNFSLQNISPLSNRSYEPNEQQQHFPRNHGYSFDIANLPAIKESLEFKEDKKRSDRSMVFQKSVEIFIGGEDSGLGRKDRERERERERERGMSLQLSNQNNQERNDKDQYENLRRLYQQSVQCLQMEQKKTKSMQAQYQKYVQIITTKQKLDPDRYNLQKQLVYLTRLSIEQQQTIEEQRKSYNEIFKGYHQSFKSELSDKLNSLRNQSRSSKARSENNNMSM